MTRKTEKPLVRIVDDDPDQLASLEIMLSAEGWDVACYERASDFFAEDTPSRPGCLILDVRMPEISGLEMQEELNRREYPLPILFLTGHGDVDMAVHTLKKGAKDFLLKPVDAPRLLTSVATIVQEDCDQRSMPLDSAAWKRKFRELTEREQEIVRYVASLDPTISANFEHVLREAGGKVLSTDFRFDAAYEMLVPEDAAVRFESLVHSISGGEALLDRQEEFAS